MKTTFRPYLKVLLAGALMATGMVAATGPAATAEDLTHTIDIPLPDQGNVFVKAKVGNQQFVVNQPGRSQQSLRVTVTATVVSGVAMTDSTECDPGTAEIDKNLSLVVGGHNAASVQVVHRYTPAGSSTAISEELVSQSVQAAGPSSVPLAFDVCA